MERGKNWCENYQIVNTAQEFTEVETGASPHYGYGIRHIQMLLLFLCLVADYMTSFHLGVTIVAMTTRDGSDTNAETLPNNTSVDSAYNYTGMSMINESLYNLNENNYTYGNSSESWNIYRIYPWPKTIQEMVLSSASLGRMIMMFPIGFICQRWGGKVILQTTLAINCVTSIPIPWLTVWGGWKALCFCCILQGLAESGAVVAIHPIITNWVPMSERCTAVGFVYTGIFIGNVIAYQLSGLLSSNSNLGWPSVYWVIGALNLVLFAVISIFLEVTPSNHKYISIGEKNFILGQVNAGFKPVQKRKIPWKSLFSSIPLWSVWINQITAFVVAMFCNQQVPSYIHHILKVNIKSNGLLSSLPYIVSTFACLIYGSLSDFLTNRKIVKVRTARIIFNSIGKFGVGLCLAMIPFTTNVVLATTYFIMAMTLFSACHAAGVLLGFMDLAPNYIGIIMAIGNTMSCALQLLCSFLITRVLVDLSNQIQWRIIFLMIAVLPIAGNVIYILYISVEKEPWNDRHTVTTVVEEIEPINEEQPL